MNTCPHQTWVEIDLQAIIHNTRKVIETTRKPLMVVVKDNAYGHGAVEVARSVLQAGAASLAVVRLPEAEELRKAGIESPIMIFGGITEAQADKAIALNCTVPVYDLGLARLFSARAQALGKKLDVHLKMDTGLGRFGVFPSEVVSFAKELKTLGGLQVSGIFSHFSAAEEEGHPITLKQIQRFEESLTNLQTYDLRPEWAHLSGSAGIFHVPQARFDLVRAGGIIFGLGELSYDPEVNGIDLKRAFTWKAQLMSCKRVPAGWGIGYNQKYITKKEEFIGVVPVGHGDGYQKAPRGEVLVKGQRIPIVGSICMDQFMIRLPDMVPIGTEVVLIGRQGEEQITPEETADRWKASVAAATNIKKRVPRIYQ
ncbi:MAG: alanine racemase [Anaerolineaceae bacterium]|nr:alanine racemase [Anaerolineaceae bacterium]